MPRPLYPHNRGFRAFSTGGTLNPPGGYAGVVGPAPNEATIDSRYNAPQRQYVGGWRLDAAYGGMCYADYNLSTTGAQYYILAIFARVPTMVTMEYVKDSGNDGGTGDATMNGETVPFNANGTSGEPGFVSFIVPAGEHTLTVRKLLRQSLYVRSVFLATA